MYLYLSILDTLFIERSEEDDNTVDLGAKSLSPILIHKVLHILCNDRGFFVEQHSFHQVNFYSKLVILLQYLLTRIQYPF